MNKTEFQMWAQLAYCKELTNNDLKGLMIILTYHNAIVRGSKWNNTPNKVIAKSLGLSDRRTIDVINRLVNMGLVTRQKKVHGNANHLHPNLEAIEGMINRNMEELGIVTSASPIKEGYMTETSPTIVTSASPTIVTETSPNTNGTMERKKENVNRTPISPNTTQDETNQSFLSDASQVTVSQSNDELNEPPIPDDLEDFINAQCDIFNEGTTVQYDDVPLDNTTTFNTAIEQTHYPSSPSKEDCAPFFVTACHSAKDLRRHYSTMVYDNPNDEDFKLLTIGSTMDSLILDVLNTTIHIIEANNRDQRLNAILDNVHKSINGLSPMNQNKLSYMSKYNEAKTLLNAA